jgi:hypothetical protein
MVGKGERIMIKIGYVTEICKPYVDGVKKCKSKEELEEFVNLYWRELAQDALDAIRSKDFIWSQYKAGMKMEKRGQYSGDEWAEKYAAILLPGVIMFIGLQAQRFCAPEGCVFIRLEQEGFLKKDKGGIYYLDLPKESVA